MSDGPFETRFQFSHLEVREAFQHYKICYSRHTLKLDLHHALCTLDWTIFLKDSPVIVGHTGWWVIYRYKTTPYPHFSLRNCPPPQQQYWKIIPKFVSSDADLLYAYFSVWLKDIFKANAKFPSALLRKQNTV